MWQAGWSRAISILHCTWTSSTTASGSTEHDTEQNLVTQRNSRSAGLNYFCFLNNIPLRYWAEVASLPHGAILLTYITAVYDSCMAKMPTSSVSSKPDTLQPGLLREMFKNIQATNCWWMILLMSFSTPSLWSTSFILTCRSGLQEKTAYVYYGVGFIDCSFMLEKR